MPLDLGLPRQSQLLSSWLSLASLVCRPGTPCTVPTCCTCCWTSAASPPSCPSLSLRQGPRLQSAECTLSFELSAMMSRQPWKALQAGCSKRSSLPAREQRQGLCLGHCSTSPEQCLSHTEWTLA